MTSARLQRQAHQFTLDEALAKVGRQVRVVAPIPDVPLDTLGTVLAVSGSSDSAMVLVEWTSWRPGFSTHHTTPLGRWFNRLEYEDLVREV